LETFPKSKSKKFPGEIFEIEIRKGVDDD